MFHTVNGTPYNDSNLLHRFLKPAGKKLGMPWLNWHTLRRTHITLFQVVGGSLRDATTVEKLSVLMANDGKLDQNPEGLPLISQQIQ